VAVATLPLFWYKFAAVYFSWLVYTHICHNLWSKGISSGWSLRGVSCQVIKRAFCWLIYWISWGRSPYRSFESSAAGHQLTGRNISED